MEDKDNKKFSTLNTWARMIVNMLRARGQEPEPLLASVGIQLAEIEDPGHRISDRKLRLLYPACEQALDDPLFGLHLGEHFQVDTLHALGFALLSSDTIEDLLGRMARYSTMVSSSAEASLVREEDGLTFVGRVMRDEEGELLLPHAAIAAFFAGLVQFMRQLTGEAVCPIRVLFVGQGADKAAYEASFGCPVYFDEEQFELTVDFATALLPVRSRNAQLAAHQDKLIEAYIAQMDGGFDQIVYQQLLQLLPSGEFSPEILASRLNISPRTLQHRLQQCGSSYQQLLDKVRQQTAEQLLDNQSYSITEISFLLGFSNGAAFSRAFRRWHGCSPAQYRQGQFG